MIDKFLEKSVRFLLMPLLVINFALVAIAAPYLPRNPIAGTWVMTWGSSVGTMVLNRDGTCTVSENGITYVGEWDWHGKRLQIKERLTSSQHKRFDTIWGVDLKRHGDGWAGYLGTVGGKMWFRLDPVEKLKKPPREE